MLNAACNYDILSNPNEVSQLFFRGMEKREDNPTFDLIPCCLYLGEDLESAE